MSDAKVPSTFRRQLRVWLETEIGGSVSRLLSHPERRTNTIRLYDAGFGGLTWPTAYGGQGLDDAFQVVFNEETRPYTGAFLDQTVTVGICARTLLDVGTDDQKSLHLRAMLRGEETWCQLLSEPSAGSDLARVRTLALRVADGYLMNGQKVWTSDAQNANFAMALVRTNTAHERHAGISMIMVDMAAPQIDIRPLRDMTGSAVFNEVFLTDVPIGLDAIVGTEDGGWSVLTCMLGHERTALSAATAGQRMDKDASGMLLALARAAGMAGDTHIEHLIATIYAQQRALELMGTMMRSAEQAGLPAGPLGSLGKIGTARAVRLVAETTTAINGLGAQAWPESDDAASGSARAYLSFPKAGIAGGTTEIQKNVIAERLLGLPR